MTPKQTKIRTTEGPFTQNAFLEKFNYFFRKVRCRKRRETLAHFKSTLFIFIVWKEQKWVWNTMRVNN